MIAENDRPINRKYWTEASRLPNHHGIFPSELQSMEVLMFRRSRTVISRNKTFAILCGRSHLFWQSDPRRNPDVEWSLFGSNSGLFGAQFGAGVLGWRTPSARPGG